MTRNGRRRPQHDQPNGGTPPSTLSPPWSVLAFLACLMPWLIWDGNVKSPLNSKVWVNSCQFIFLIEVDWTIVWAMQEIELTLSYNIVLSSVYRTRVKLWLFDVNIHLTTFFSLLFCDQGTWNDGFVYVMVHDSKHDVANGTTSWVCPRDSFWSIYRPGSICFRRKTWPLDCSTTTTHRASRLRHSIHRNRQAHYNININKSTSIS